MVEAEASQYNILSNLHDAGIFKIRVPTKDFTMLRQLIVCRDDLF